MPVFSYLNGEVWVSVGAVVLIVILIDITVINIFCSKFCSNPDERSDSDDSAEIASKETKQVKAIATSKEGKKSKGKKNKKKQD